MKNFKSDVIHWEDYDYVVINDNLEICLQKIVSFIESSLSEKNSDYDKRLIYDHVKKLIK